jgi:hypothetical protein
MQIKNRNGQVLWDTWEPSIFSLLGDGLPYWLRAPRIPPLLRAAGFRKPVKDNETLDLFRPNPA